MEIRITKFEVQEDDLIPETIFFTTDERCQIKIGDFDYGSGLDANMFIGAIVEGATKEEFLRSKFFGDIFQQGLVIRNWIFKNYIRIKPIKECLNYFARNPPESYYRSINWAKKGAYADREIFIVEAGFQKPLKVDSQKLLERFNSSGGLDETSLTSYKIYPVTTTGFKEILDENLIEAVIIRDYGKAENTKLLIIGVQLFCEAKEDPYWMGFANEGEYCDTQDLKVRVTTDGKEKSAIDEADIISWYGFECHCSYEMASLETEGSNGVYEFDYDSEINNPFGLKGNQIDLLVGSYVNLELIMDEDIEGKGIAYYNKRIIPSGKLAAHLKYNIPDSCFSFIMDEFHFEKNGIIIVGLIREWSLDAIYYPLYKFTRDFNISLQNIDELFNYKVHARYYKEGETLPNGSVCYKSGKLVKELFLRKHNSTIARPENKKSIGRAWDDFELYDWEVNLNN